MRIYTSCVEMLDETYREIWKRGQRIFDRTVQSKIVTEGEGYEQKELIYYNFRVDNFDDIKEMLEKSKQMFNKEHHQLKVAEKWFEDMVHNNTLHEKWWEETEYTKKYFKEFCDEGNGNASYSYGERIIPQLDALITKLRKNKYSRGAVITMPTLNDICQVGRRVPCTSSYHFICRPTLQGDKLNLVVNQRSCDAINFFPLDFAKSFLFLQHIAKETGLEVGYVIMSITSLHVYAKDLPEIYKW
jgi:thymidylate synthase